MALIQPFIEQSVACRQNKNVKVKYSNKPYMELYTDNDERNNAPC